ncbi:MAG TPA: TIGR03084 family metal-binding protein [Acidimicrobiales bacterium]|nr:TIGR03084 family metal-binding protein [Acidimicrobiales bacterium]
MAVATRQLGDDLMAETEDLLCLVTPLDRAGWDTATPAPGWSVADQVGHLAYFDEQLTLAATDPDAFRERRREALVDVEGFIDAAVGAVRSRPTTDLVPWLGRSRRAMLEATGTVAPGTRVPWFGPDMSVASALTARIMETWAHGQDVADAVGRTRQPTSRLRHVCFLGYRSFSNSFRSRGLEVPDAEVRVELDGPDGNVWAFGPPAAADQVHGSALDFCLVVTQRRHRDDTDLVSNGDVASHWLDIAQAFAGPPGPGRQPGLFPS